MTKEDELRCIFLEDRLFEMALLFHLNNRHESYLPDCENRECAENREVLGTAFKALYVGSVETEQIQTDA